MHVFKLFQFGCSQAEPGLWADHDKRDTGVMKFGIGLKFFAGDSIRHGLKMKYWPEMWKRELAIKLLNSKLPLWVKTRVSRWTFRSAFPSAWKAHDPEYHYFYKWWSPIAPFFYVHIGSWGFYIGFKIARIDNPKRFLPMGIKKEDIYEESEALVATVSMRRTRE